MISTSWFRVGVIALAFPLLQACTITVPVTTPNVSATPYAASSTMAPVEMQMSAQLPENHQVSQGALPIKVAYQGATLDAETFVLENLRQELVARDLDVVSSDASENALTLLDFNVLHHRVSGFSPMVTISTLKADLETPAGTKRVASMIKRAKVPVWTMDEINDPCYNEPIELMIKELAAKINQAYFDYSLDNETVQTLINKIDQETGDSRLAYFDVFELGFSNNPSAIPALYKYTTHSSDYVRLAAISSLGILGATEHYAHLKSIYESAQIWQDRGMALKAIGDLGTDEALAYLSDVQDQWKNASGNEAIWNSRIISLYLD